MTSFIDLAHTPMTNVHADLADNRLDLIRLYARRVGYLEARLQMLCASVDQHLTTPGGNPDLRRAVTTALAVVEDTTWQTDEGPAS
jgi:hypothetical protein